MTNLLGRPFLSHVSATIAAITAPTKPTPMTTTISLPSLRDRKSTRLNSSHLGISYAVFCLKKKKFILSDSGGSQGLGFAIPGALVQMAYPKLRRYGHLHRGEIGILLQTITPTLARGLQLAP